MSLVTEAAWISALIQLNTHAFDRLWVYKPGSFLKVVLEIEVGG